MGRSYPSKLDNNKEMKTKNPTCIGYQVTKQYGQLMFMSLYHFVIVSLHILFHIKIYAVFCLNVFFFFFGKCFPNFETNNRLENDSCSCYIGHICIIRLLCVSAQQNQWLRKNKQNKTLKPRYVYKYYEYFQCNMGRFHTVHRYQRCN